jgi:hypothetical protein
MSRARLPRRRCLRSCSARLLLLLPPLLLLLLLLAVVVEAWVKDRVKKRNQESLAIGMTAPRMGVAHQVKMKTAN